MTSIKSPQTVSHIRSNSGHAGHGFITMLLLLTWIAIGAGFYAVKTGMIQPAEINPAISEKLSALENSSSILDARMKTIEKRLSEASSILSPAVTDTIEKPEMEAKPEDAKPAAPAESGAATHEEGTMAPKQEPVLTEPNQEVKPEEKGVTKPQTNNKGGETDQTALLVKKNYA